MLKKLHEIDAKLRALHAERDNLALRIAKKYPRGTEREGFAVQVKDNFKAAKVFKTTSITKYDVRVSRI